MVNVRTCVDCGRYKFIVQNGLCRDCYKKLFRSSEYEITYNPSRLLSDDINGEFVFGKIGYGKTIANKIETVEILKDNPNTDIYIIDPIGIYDEFVEEFSGNKIAHRRGDPVDPLATQIINTDERFVVKRDRIKELIINFADKLGYAMSKFERDILERAITMTFIQNGISRSSVHPTGTPSYQDLVDNVRKIQRNPEEMFNMESSNKSEIVADIQSAYKKIRRVQIEFDLHGRSNGMKIDSNSAINYIKIDTGGGYSGLHMMLVFSWVWQHATSGENKSVIYLDHARRMLKDIKESTLFRSDLNRSKEYGSAVSMTVSGDHFMYEKDGLYDRVDSLDITRIHKVDGDAKIVNNGRFGIKSDGVNYLEHASHSDILLLDDIVTRETINVDDSLLEDIEL